MNGTSIYPSPRVCPRSTRTSGLAEFNATIEFALRSDERIHTRACR